MFIQKHPDMVRPSDEWQDKLIRKEKPRVMKVTTRGFLIKKIKWKYFYHKIFESRDDIPQTLLPLND